MDLGLKGRPALVMGGSRGLGRAIAEELCAEGAQVLIAARDQTVLDQAAARMGATGIAADLSDPAQAAQLVRSAQDKFGRLDVLVINSGGPGSGGSIMASTAADWEREFRNVWLLATESIRAALPGMIERQWGRIILVTSLAAVEPEPGLMYSNSLRAGLHGLVNSVSRDIARHGVTLNAAAPGYMATERVNDIGADHTEMYKRIPAGRYGEPREFAAMVAFLASARASYVNGQAFACDGGLLKSIF
jgi:3-oxoacyl-[acyl-carrier protein] reductase